MSTGRFRIYNRVHFYYVKNRNSCFYIRGRGGIGRLDGFRFRYLSGVRVRVPPPAPNKHDSFDTNVSETIVLFLFAEAPVTQGFSAQLLFGLVSL